MTKNTKSERENYGENYLNEGRLAVLIPTSHFSQVYSVKCVFSFRVSVPIIRYMFCWRKVFVLTPGVVMYCTTLCFVSFTVCTFNFRSTLNSAGSFTSPNYGGEYPRLTVCNYLFFGRENEQVVIEFLQFDVDGIIPR